MSLTNKAVFSVYNFEYPILLLLFQVKKDRERERDTDCHRCGGAKWIGFTEKGLFFFLHVKPISSTTTSIMNVHAGFFTIVKSVFSCFISTKTGIHKENGSTAW